MTTLSTANHLSSRQRQCLIDHARGPQVFRAIESAETNGLRATKQSLIDLKLLRPTSTHLSPRPAELMLTTEGQEVVCIILGRMVEALIGAGCLEPLTAQKVFAAIEEASQRTQRKRPLKCTEKNAPYHAVATPAESLAQSICRDRDATKELERRITQSIGS